jgi:hypothetical protein
MVILYNIIGCTFLGLTAYFLWSIDGWLWIKALVAFMIGFIFIASSHSMKEDKHDDSEWLEYIDKLQKENAHDTQKLDINYAKKIDSKKPTWFKEKNDA